VGLSSGFVEVNPALSGAGNAAPLVGLALKYGLKYALIEWGELDARGVNTGVESVSMAAACWNISIITGGTNPVSAAAALACGAIYLTQIAKLE